MTQATPATDIHQHLWPEPLLAGLARRSEEPMLVRHRDGWKLRLHAEPESPVELADHDPDRRVAAIRARGLQRALIAPSTPLGIEALPEEESRALLDAYHAGLAELPNELGAWASVALARPDAHELERLLDGGFAGACIAADALAGAGGYEALAPVLEVLERRGAPLFIHPGPAPATLAAGRADGVPPWWPAMTTYVGGMNAAWHAFAVFGRAAYPRLRVCFAMLAGLAPLHRERLVARGGRPFADPDVFLDTSSYGPRAVDAVIRELGVDRLVHGSDVPVVADCAPPLHLGEAVRVALRERNPHRLLTNASTEVAA